MNWVSSQGRSVHKVQEVSALRTYEWMRVARQIDKAVIDRLLSLIV